MIRNEEQWLAVADAFQSAAMGSGDWSGALGKFARATGSYGGQLIGLGSNHAVPFNFVSGIDPGFVEDFAARGGGDPRINPRVRAGIGVPPLTVLAERDYLTESEYRTNPHRQEMQARWGLAFSCLTPLETRDKLLIGLAVMRTAEEGHITTPQREIFTSLAVHARAAVRTQLALEGQGAKLLAGAFDAVSIPAFICDDRGRVRAHTSPAEALLTPGCGLQMTDGRLQASDPAVTRVLDEAIDAAAACRRKPGAPAQRTVVVRGTNADARPIVLTIASLPPGPHSMGFAPRVLVIANGSLPHGEHKSSVLKALFDLTAAEAEIALQLTTGNNAETIANGRGVSVGTVRVQIRSILAKVGVGSQLELVARINSL